MDEITIVLTDDTKRRINEMLCEERDDARRNGCYHDDDSLHDDEQTYWAN